MWVSYTLPPRSFLYVPGTRADLFAKASSGPADAVVLDLEDSVPVAQKESARRSVSDWLTAGGERAAQQWVRLEADYLEVDLEAAVHPRLDGLFLAKCSIEGMYKVASLLGRLEEQRGLTLGSLRLVGLLESAQGLQDLPSMARQPRLLTFGIGEVDLLADLRMVRSERSSAALDAIRTLVVLHAAAAGLQAPVAPTSTAFRDLDAFAESTRHFHDLGFRSRTAVHPAQVAVIHDVLTPDEKAVEAARDVLARFEAASDGVTTDEQGQLIDAAVVRGARETLARAGTRL